MCENYVGETGRSLGVRMSEHTDGKHQSSAIHEHTQNTGHRLGMDDVRILQREEKWFPRKIKEAMEIHKKQPPLNRDRGHEIHPTLLQLLARDQPGHVTSIP